MRKHFFTLPHNYSPVSSETLLAMQIGGGGGAGATPDQGQIWRDMDSTEVEIISTYIGASGALRVEFIRKGTWQDLSKEDFINQYFPYSPMKYANKSQEEYWGAAHTYTPREDNVKCDCGGLMVVWNLYTTVSGVRVGNKKVKVPVELHLDHYKALIRLSKLAGVSKDQFTSVLLVLYLYQEGKI